MSQRKHFCYSAVISILLFNLAACGGGDSGGQTETGPDLPEQTNLYYLTDRTVGSELVAVDPNNPPTSADPENVILSSVNFLSVFFDVTPDFNDYDLNDRTNLDLTGYSFEPYVVAHNASGFSKISADISQSNPVTQVSTSPGGTLCDIEYFDSISKQYYIIETSDDGCVNIARRHMVDSEMDSGATPIDVPVMPLAQLFNTQYQTTGWLVNNNGILTRYDPNFSTPTNIDTMPAGVTELWAWPTPLGTYLLGSLTEFFIYDPTANSLTNVHSAPQGAQITRIFDYDPSGFAFVEGNTIYRADWAFNNPPDIIATEPGVDEIMPFSFTFYNTLIYSYSPATGETILVAVDLGTGVQTTLDTLPAGDDIEIQYQTRDRVFYNVSGPATLRAESVRIDNTGRQTFANAEWLGYSFGTELDNEGYYSDITMILLANAIPGQTNLNGTVLETYDADTLVKRADIGAFPDGLDEVSYISGSSQGLLFNVYLTSNLTREVFFMSSLVDDSLQRITDNDLHDIVLSGTITITGNIPVVVPFSGTDSGQEQLHLASLVSPRNLLLKKPLTH